VTLFPKEASVRFRSFLVAAAMVANASLAPATAQQDHDTSKAVTVQGEILDLVCFVAHDGNGPKHAASAAKCLRQGQPMGLLAKDGTVYILFGDHDDVAAFVKAKEFVGKNVEIVGPAANRDGVKGIIVASVRPL